MDSVRAVLLNNQLDAVVQTMEVPHPPPPILYVPVLANLRTAATADDYRHPMMLRRDAYRRVSGPGEVVLYVWDSRS